MFSGHKHADGPLSEFQEEAAQPLAVFFIQDRETWERAPLATVKGRRNPPDAAVPVAQFCFLFRCVLLQTIRRVGHNGVDGVLRPVVHPRETVAKLQTVTHHCSL